MTYLPIVQRELRAAARRKSTYRLRWWTASLAMVAGFVTLAIVWFSRSRPGYGNPVFSLLTAYAFGLCLLSGVLLTADALSAEKRDGTLGLLFLSNLKGYDVVLGKFLATSLNAIYGLLALLPITGVPLVLGGVAGAEYWRMSLALLNALFVSLTAGLGVSVFMRDAHRSRGLTLGLVLLLAFGLPAMAELSALTRYAPPWVALTRLSPFYPYLNAMDAGYAGNAEKFWGPLFGSHLLGWAFLAVASVALPRLWQERADTPEPGGRLERWLRRRWGTPAQRAKVRAELLPRNPIVWLVRDELGVQWGAWIVVLAWGVVVLAAAMTAPRGARLLGMGGWYGTLPFGFGLLFKALFAFSACRFFAEGRRSGALEMLLCTPLTSWEITRGQAQAVWRSYLWPLVALAALLFGPPGVSVLSALSSGEVGEAFAALGGSTLSLLYGVSMLIDLSAVCWFGMWLALSMKQPALAPALTIFLVLIVPAPFCYGSILIDVFLISWAMAKLQHDLRWTLSQQYHPTSSLPVTPLAAPPVINQF